jgi:MFS family permease
MSEELRPAASRLRGSGWDATGLAFVANMIVAGSTIYAYGVFTVAVGSDLGGTRFEFGLAHTATLLIMALLSPVIGTLLDRFGVRMVMLLGGSALGAGLLTLGAAPSIAVFLGTYAVLIGLAEVLTGPLATSTLVGKRFDKGRARALAIAALGASVGGACIPAIAALLIDRYDWRVAYMALGATAWIILLPSVWLIARRQEAPSLVAGSKAGGRGGWREIVAEPNFWRIAITIGLAYFAMQGGLVNLVPLAVSRGITPLSASLLVSAMTAGAVFGKMATAAIGDRLAPPRLLLSSLMSLVAGLVLLALSSWPVMIAAALLFGLGWGGLYPQLGVAVGYYFGREQFGRTMGFIYPVTSFFAMLAAPFWGLIYDRTGSYEIPLIAAVVSTLAAILLVLTMRERAREPAQH